MSDAEMSDSQPLPDGEVPEVDATVVGKDGLQPETQGDEPLDAELGDEGQGDLGEGDGRQHSGDAPDDLRTEPPQESPVTQETPATPNETRQGTTHP